MRDCFTPQSKLDIIGGKYRVPTSHPYSPSVLDFLGRMLTVDPASRCHIGEVLRCIDALKRDMPLPPRRRRSVETILTTEDSTTGEIKQTTFRVLEQHTSLPDDDMHHAQAYYQGGNNSAHQHPAFSSAMSDSAAMMHPIEDEEMQDDDMQQFNSSFTDKSDSDGTEVSGSDDITACQNGQLMPSFCNKIVARVSAQFRRRQQSTEKDGTDIDDPYEWRKAHDGGTTTCQRKGKVCCLDHGNNGTDQSVVYAEFESYR